MDDKRVELTKELKRARNWILGVGIALVAVDQIYFARSIPAGADPNLVREARNWQLMFDGIVLAFFVGMYVLAHWKAVLACVLALVGFWGLSLWAIDFDLTQLWRGLAVNVLFTFFLIRGIISANRAQQLQTELGQIFE
jgi:hypothetical protein